MQCVSVGHMLCTVTGGTLTAKAFHDRLQKKDGEINSKMFGILANVRGSREYFSKLAMDVKWMIRRLGPPAVGVIVTNLSVAPSFHRQVIVVFSTRYGVFAACVRAAGRATSCLLMLSVLRQC